MIRSYNDIDLHAFADDRVGPERRDAITAFLKTAPVEAVRVAAWRRQGDAIRAMFAAISDEPVPLWLTVGQIAAATDKPTALAKSAVARLPQTRVAARRPSFRGSLLLAVVAFAAGAGSALIGARWIGQSEWHPAAEDIRPNLVRRALEAHTTFTVDPDRPAEVGDSADGALQAWLSRRVSFPIRIPDLGPQGLVLKGGRIAPGVDGPGALLVYEKTSGERVSLFMDRLSPGVPALGLLQDDVLAWSSGGIGYAIVATGGAAWLGHHGMELQAATRASPSP